MYPRNDHRGHRTRMALCLALLLGIAAAAAACGARQPTPAPDVDEAFLPEAVVSATGRVVPVTWAELAFATPGRVHEILISEGDRVDAGQVLARLDAAELEAGVAQAEDALTTARAQLAQLEAGARAALAKAELRAPFAGTVPEVSLRVGEYITMGVPVLALGDSTTLRVETTDLDEIDVARVAEGRAVAITFDALPNVTLRGTVQRIALRAGTGAGGTTYKVTIGFDETDPRLRWGMTAFVDIETE